MSIIYTNKDGEKLEYGYDNWNPNEPDWTIYLEVDSTNSHDQSQLVTFDSVEDMETFHTNIGKMIEKVKEVRNHGLNVKRDLL